MTTYCRPGSVQEAVQALADAGGAGRVLVGGTDLLVGVRRRPLDPIVLVDLKVAADLPPAIELTERAVRFGPTAVMTDLAANAELRRWYPALVAASRVVGSVAIRNRASLIGNIANASPAADTAPALLVHQASVTIVGPGGERELPLTDFFLGPGDTACGPDELVLRLTLPLPPEGYHSAFERLTRRRGVDLATVSVAAGLSSDGIVTLGFGAVGPTPLVARSSESIDPADASAIDRVVAELIEITSPISDVRAGETYRRAMTAVLARRAIVAAGGTTNGGQP
ncbi:MAG: FAD binding domain-containing protein [Actinomycetota bacterium]